MSTSQPPKIATWIFQRAFAGFGKESLLGDLTEEYHLGRSRAWYWQQIAMAVLINWYGVVRGHYVLTVRAIALGYGATYLLNQLFWKLLALKATVEWTFNFPLLGLTAVVAIGISVGWLVGRFHRPYQMAMVVATIVFAILMDMPNLVRLAFDSMEHERFAPYIIFQLRGLLVWSLGVVTGGLLSARPKSALASPKNV